jgi:Bacterial Ig-like domain (group 1)
MKKFVSMMMVAAATLVLASCGGGTGSGPLTGNSGSTGTTTTPSVKSLTLTTSNPQIPSDGSKTTTISALLRDANNNVLSGVAVAFQASSGALTVTKGTTGSDGTATATLSSAGDPSNRTITVTAIAGSITTTVTVDVVGTKLSLSGPTSLVLNATGNYTATLQDAAGNGISGQTATVASAKDNTLNPSTFTTDANGQGAFTVTAVNSGTDTITASAAGLKATESVSVSSDAFSFSSPAASPIPNVNIGTSETVTVVWKNSGSPVANTAVTFAATRGTLNGTSLNSATVNTDSSGSASVTISSTTAGPSVISASGTGPGGGVSAQLTINFVATTPSAMDVQASPATVATQGQSTITATVRDANNNLVQGETVDFSITQDSTGGSLSAASGVTNEQGQATTVYTASTTTSASNGVIIGASIPGTSVTGSTSLTVGGATVSLALGTGNQITALPNTTQYELPYTVQAVDSAGNPVSGVKVNFTVDSLGYIKGCRLWNSVTSCVPFVSTASGTGAWVAVSTTTSGDPEAFNLDGITGCLTEDANNDGIEDNNYNNDINIIFPGEVVSTDVTSATTDTSGTASVNLIYPKDHASYVAVQLTATATVQGTQSSTSVKFWLPVLAGDVQSTSSAPPGPYSPYGTASTCGSAN